MSDEEQEKRIAELEHLASSLNKTVQAQAERIAELEGEVRGLKNHNTMKNLTDANVVGRKSRF